MKAFSERVRDAVRHTGLTVFLASMYFLVVTPCALIWRWILRRSLFHARGGWAPVKEATDTPNIFRKTV